MNYEERMLLVYLEKNFLQMHGQTERKDMTLILEENQTKMYFLLIQIKTVHLYEM